MGTGAYIIILIIAVLTPSIASNPIQNDQNKGEDNSNVVPGVFISVDALKNLQAKAQQNGNSDTDITNRNQALEPESNRQYDTSYNSNQPAYLSQQRISNAQPVLANQQMNPQLINQLSNQRINSGYQQYLPNQQVMFGQQMNQPLQNQFSNQQMLNQQPQLVYQNGQIQTLVPQQLTSLSNGQQIVTLNPGNGVGQVISSGLNLSPNQNSVYTVVPLNNGQNAALNGGSYLVPVQTMPQNQVLG